MGCKFINKCNSKLKNKICGSNDLIPMCSLRLQLKKEHKSRQRSIKHLQKHAKKLNW